jgi:PAS domain S-box-containing protein
MPNARILIAEDEILEARDLAWTLAEAGYDVVGRVSSGQEAVRVARQTRPDLILMDIKLEGEIDGIEAADRIRSGCDAAIVYLTAHGDSGLFQRAKLTEPYGYLSKPVSTHELKRTVEMALFKHGLELKLRKSEQTVSAVLAASPVGICLSRAGRIQWANEAWRQMFGYSTEGEYLNQPTSILHGSPADYSRVRQVLYSGLRHGPTGEADTALRRKDGALFHAHLKITWLDPLDHAAGTVSAIADVSARARAEDALAREKHRFEALAESSPFGMVLIQPDGSLEYINPKFREMLGYGPEDLPNAGAWYQAAYPDREYRGKVIAAWLADLEKAKPGEQRPRTWTVKSKHGTEKVVHFRPVLLPSGEHIVTCEDISERKQMEESLRASESRYRRIYDDTPVMMHSIDKDRIIRNVNKKWLNTLGYTRYEVVGARIDMILTPESRESLIRILPEFWARGEVQDLPYEYVKKDRTVMNVLLNSIVWDDPTWGAVSLSVIRDVSGRKLLEKQLIHAQKMEAVGTLAGGVAHDFNNLLQIVLGYSDMLLFDRDPNHPDYEALAQIRHAARGGRDLVKGLLAFSRKLEGERCPVNLNQEIVRIEKLLSRMIPKMIAIDLKLAGNLWTIEADPSQIEQVVMNLAVNAQHAMPDGGRFSIETRNVGLDEDYCKAHLDAKPGRRVLLSVSDTGHGMTKDRLERIFEPFYTTKGPGEGTGLGLAIVYGIVKSHSGHIECYSEPGVGSVFRIYFPAIESRVEDDVATTGETPAFGAETILLVDDEAAIREIDAKALSRQGYTVLTASSGTDALSVYRSRTREISLVILDLIMPEMGGKQCMEELLKINPKAKVLIASGFSNEGIAGDSLECGAKGFISKPFSANELCRMVRKVLDQD